jgi:hypothetical protein
MSLIPLSKDYLNTHFDTSTLPSSGGSLKFVHRPMYLSYIRTVEAVYKMLQYSLLPLYVKLYNSVIKIGKIVVKYYNILY